MHRTGSTFVIVLVILLALTWGLPQAGAGASPASGPASSPAPSPLSMRPASAPATKPSTPASAPTLKRGPTPATTPVVRVAPASAPVVRAPTSTSRPPRRGPRRRALGATLAVLNLGRTGAAGWDVAQRARLELARWVGGWAQQPGVGDHLVAHPRPGVLPSNESGQELGQLLQRIRSGGRPSASRLWELGRLLGVDYVLVLRVRKASLSARLFSVQRQRWAPQGFEQRGHATGALRAFVLEQGRAGRRRKSDWSWRKKWWVWAIAGALAAVTLGFALAEGDKTSGTLRIRVSRDTP